LVCPTNEFETERESIAAKIFGSFSPNSIKKEGVGKIVERAGESSSVSLNLMN